MTFHYGLSKVLRSVFLFFHIFRWRIYSVVTLSVIFVFSILLQWDALTVNFICTFSPESISQGISSVCASLTVIFLGHEIGNLHQTLDVICSSLPITYFYDFVFVFGLWHLIPFNIVPGFWDQLIRLQAPAIACFWWLKSISWNK